MLFVEVGEEPGVDWLPAEQLAGQRARGWTVGPDESGKPAEDPFRCTI